MIFFLNSLGFNKDVCDIHKYFWIKLYYLPSEMTLITCIISVNITDVLIDNFLKNANVVRVFLA